MKKKITARKLRLSRETLRELEEEASRQAVGGDGDLTWVRNCASRTCDEATNFDYLCG